MVIEPREYDAALSFSKGFAAICIRNGFAAKWGYIDKIGKMVIDPQFSRVTVFNCRECLKNMKGGLYRLCPNYETYSYWRDIADPDSKGGMSF